MVTPLGVASALDSNRLQNERRLVVPGAPGRSPLTGLIHVFRRVSFYKQPTPSGVRRPTSISAHDVRYPREHLLLRRHGDPPARSLRRHASVANFRHNGPQIDRIERGTKSQKPHAAVDEGVIGAAPSAALW